MVANVYAYIWTKASAGKNKQQNILINALQSAKKTSTIEKHSTCQRMCVQCVLTQALWYKWALGATIWCAFGERFTPQKREVLMYTPLGNYPANWKISAHHRKHLYEILESLASHVIAVFGQSQSSLCNTCLQMIGAFKVHKSYKMLQSVCVDFLEFSKFLIIIKQCKGHGQRAKGFNPGGSVLSLIDDCWLAGCSLHMTFALLNKGRDDSVLILFPLPIYLLVFTCCHSPDVLLCSGLNLY